MNRKPKPFLYVALAWNCLLDRSWDDRVAIGACDIATREIGTKLKEVRMRTSFLQVSWRGPLAAVITSGALALAAPAAFAANNDQNGLVNVNLQSIALAVPVSVSVPVGVAANVCGINAAVLAVAAQSGTAACTATSNSTGLSTAIADAMTGTGGGNNNNQSGLVNVNVQGLALAVPVSVALPIGVAANVCDVNASVLAVANQTGGAACTATSTSNALSRALASAMA